VRVPLRKMAKWSLLLLALGVAVAVYMWHRGGEQRRIRKQLDILCARFSKSAGESNAVMAMKMHTLPDLFAEQCDLELQNFPGNGIHSPAQIGSYAARIRPGFESIQLLVYDVKILVHGDTDATVTLTARLVMKPKSVRQTEETREITCRLKKADDAWRFSEFEEVAVLEK